MLCGFVCGLHTPFFLQKETFFKCLCKDEKKNVVGNAVIEFAVTKKT